MYHLSDTISQRSMSGSISPSRREMLAATVAAPLAIMSGAREVRAADSKPNILFILADDFGYADASCYGRPDYRTPDIDRLAAGGMKFTQAYANSAVCSATRTALITGRYQYRLPVGLEEPISARNVGLPPAIPTLPSLLKKAGYGTTLIGKWHLGRLPDYGPLQSGYDHFWGFRGGGLDYFTHKSGGPSTNTEDLWDGDVKIHQNGYLTNLLGDQAVASVKAYAKAKTPFLISLHFNAPHWPWEGPDDEAESQRITSLSSYDAGTIATFGRMVTTMDLQIGRVLDELKSANIEADTIVVFTSDNGGERFSDTWPFTGKKSELLEGGLRIPAIIRWPGHIKAGSTTEQVAISMDWLPTLLAAAGAESNPAFPPDGMSLLPALTQNASPVPRKLFWRFRANSQRAMRDGDMKWLKINENTFLFNVAADPLERANLKNRQPDVYNRLVQEYETWQSSMLPEDPAASTYTFRPSDLADHFNPTMPGTPGRGR
jgi:arylsulfatase A-like enzyme